MDKSIVKLIILLSSFYLIYSNSNAQDTMIIDGGLRFINNPIKYHYYEDFDKVKLINRNDGFVTGFLIIQIDSNTKNEIYSVARAGSDSVKYSNISPTVYLVESQKYEFKMSELTVDSALERLECDSCRIYEIFSIDMLILEGYFRFLNGKRDELTNYLYYYRLFSNMLCFGSRTKWIYHYLYTDILKNKTIWKKNNDKIGYVIFEVDFNASVFSLENKKFYIPITSLYYFRDADENVLLNQGFKKTDMKIIVK